MEIIKFAGQGCIKCKVLDNILRQVDLPCELETVYMEEDKDMFEKNGVVSVPTLLIKNGQKEVTLKNAITPNMIKEALREVGE